MPSSVVKFSLNIWVLHHIFSIAGPNVHMCTRAHAHTHTHWYPIIPTCLAIHSAVNMLCHWIITSSHGIILLSEMPFSFLSLLDKIRISYQSVSLPSLPNLETLSVLPGPDFSPIVFQILKAIPHYLTAQDTYQNYPHFAFKLFLQLSLPQFLLLLPPIRQDQ